MSFFICAALHLWHARGWGTSLGKTGAQVGKAGLSSDAAQDKCNIGDTRGIQEPLVGDFQDIDESMHEMPDWWITPEAPRGHWLSPISVREAQGSCVTTKLAITETIDVCSFSLFGCACNHVPILVIWIAWVMGLVFKWCRALSFVDRVGKKNPAKSSVLKCKCSILRLPQFINECPVWTGGCHFGGP